MCEAHAHDSSAPRTIPPPPDERGYPYVVKGMTCEHCAASVTEEVEKVDGVKTVHVDLESGTVFVNGDVWSCKAVGEAVEEAGYELVSYPE